MNGIYNDNLKRKFAHSILDFLILMILTNKKEPLGAQEINRELGNIFINTMHPYINPPTFFNVLKELVAPKINGTREKKYGCINKTVLKKRNKYSVKPKFHKDLLKDFNAIIKLLNDTVAELEKTKKSLEN